MELRRYAAARGWTAVKYVDEGVSRAKDRRPALDQLAADVKRHKVDGLVCWRLDRLGRNLRHLVWLLDEWNVRGIAFVTLGEESTRAFPPGGSSRACWARLRSSNGLAFSSESVPALLGLVSRGGGWDVPS